jgi:hypothetical protein
MQRPSPVLLLAETSAVSFGIDLNRNAPGAPQRNKCRRPAAVCAQQRRNVALNLCDTLKKSRSCRTNMLRAITSANVNKEDHPD